MPSASEAPPRKTRTPTCSARPAISWRRLVLPIPGSPATSMTWRRPAVVFSNWLQRAVSSRCLPTSARSSFGVSPVMTRPLTQWLLIQNHFQILVPIPAHFAKAVFLVEPLGRKLEDGGVQVQRLIAEGAGTGFELIQNALAVAAPLISRMDAHAFDLGTLRTGTLQSAHRHQQAIAFPNQKFSPILEIHFLDSIDIIIPGTTPQVGSGLLNGMHVQICDRCSIGRLITAQGEHETCPHTFSRIAPLASSAIGCLYLLSKDDKRWGNPCQADSPGVTTRLHPEDENTDFGQIPFSRSSL